MKIICQQEVMLKKNNLKKVILKIQNKNKKKKKSKMVMKTKKKKMRGKKKKKNIRKIELKLEKKHLIILNRDISYLRKLDLKLIIKI